MPLSGIDISKYQDGIDLAKVPGEFVVVGFSDGPDAVNPLADKQCALVRKAGKELGVYHYYRNDPAEADRCAHLTSQWQDGNTVFALDAEEEHDNLPALCLAFCRRFEALTGIKPIIYTYWNLLQLYDWSDVHAAGYKLWGAWYPLGDRRIDNYNPPARQSPKYWGADMLMWQYTSMGFLPSWSGRLDLNIFYGDRTAWRRLGRKQAPMTRYIWPVPRGTGINQPFGAAPGGVNPYGGHTGMDFGTEIGTPIYAPAAGVIEYAQWFTTDNGSDNPYWITNGGGITVVLGCDGGDSPSFVFSHLRSTSKNPGDRVKQGDVIGYSGNTGKWTTGAHLHFEAIPPGFNLNSPTYGRVNPAGYCSGYRGNTTAPQAGTIKPLPKGLFVTLTAAQEKLILDRITKYVDSPISAVPTKTWATAVKRGGGRVSALQELADAKSLGLQNKEAIAKIVSDSIDYEKLATLVAGKLVEGIAITGSLAAK